MKGVLRNSSRISGTNQERSEFVNLRNADRLEQAHTLLQQVRMRVRDVVIRQTA